MRKKLSVLLLAILAFVVVACKKKVDPEFSFDKETVTINIDETYELEYSLTKDFDVEFVLSKEGIVSITGDTIKGLASGEVVITGTIKDTEVSATITIIVREEETPVVNVESVNIAGATEGFIDDKVTLTATVLPANATNKTVTWQSSDEELATVANGVVTLLAEGSVTITASAGGKSDTHVIAITEKPAEVIPVESVEITGDMEGFVGDTVNLTATVLPENATDKTVTWESSDETLATVTNGAVKLLKAGTVTITATSGEVSDTHVITIENVLVESVAITGDTEGMVDDEITLLATVLPANATDKTVTWESSDEELATVENGVVTLLGVGTVTITATSGEFEATHEITIAPKPILVETIEITGESKGFVGDEITLTATVLPEDADDKTVTWDVNVSAFATVEDGVVTLLRPGKVLVYVTSGDVSVEFEITIQTVAATIGENIFATIQDAIDAAEENDVITVLAGTHNEALTINKSNISFVPETGKEVTLTNLITIAPDDSLENISFSNFNFTGDAQFKSIGILKGFEFRNNYVYDTNLEASAYAPINRLNINAFIQFYRLANGDLFGDIFIEDNVFENVQSDIISLDRTMADTQISIMNNEFRNYGITAIRFDGGWNNGVYNIKNNIFENDELSAFSAITFRAISPLAENTQHIYIEENIFTNIGTPSRDRDGYHPGSGVITHSTYNGTPTNMYIRDNVFNHTFNSVHLNVTNSNFTHEISGNIFNDPIGYTFFKSGSTISYVNNTYYDRLGVEVAAERVITTVETDFISVHIEDPVLEGFTIVGENIGEVTDQITLALEATPPYFLLENVVWTSSDDELATVEDGVVTLLQAGTVTITAQYEDMEETFEITISEKVAAFIGEVEYATIQAAIDAAQDDDVINVNKGVFNEELIINKPLTLNGFSEGKSFLTEKVTIEAGLINVTITGFSMTGNFQVRSVGILTNFTFTNNYVFDTELLGSGYVPNSRTNVNAIIQLYAGAGTNVFGDIFIEDNIFDNIQSDIIAIDRTMKDTEISIRNNDFLNFRIGAIRFDGGYNNGTYNIIGNKFENDQKQASAAITFRAYAPENIAGNVQTINILDNTFINIGNEQSNPVDSYPASAVIGASTFNSNPIDFNITNNMFVNTHNTVHLRKGGNYDNNTWDVDITNNTFQNTTGFMYREDGEIALFAENIYLDETGNPVSEEKVSDETTSTLRIVRIVPEIAEYVVVYYTFNADTNRYDVVEETFSGIVGTTITIVAEPPLGFYSEELEYVGVIEANGSLVIEVFYEVYLDAFRYELELNGGNTFYATRDEMVDDWIADYNEYGGTSYTIESLPMAEWGNIDIHTFFYDQRFREKWLWVAQYLAVVGSSTNKGSAAAIVSRDTVSAFEGANVNYKYAISYEVRGFMAGRKYVENANWQSADYSDSGLKFGFWESLINGRQKTEFLSTSAEVVLPTEVYLENYEFLGWYDNPDFEGEVYLVITEEKTLYAKFEEKDPVTDLII
ncbi:MAG TPA: hypothetical protein GX742_00980, partial [Acholeplasmataceae bacterium]|nr:hypothetical protein [Acholeplasmataceae bacterium]